MIVNVMINIIFSIIIFWITSQAILRTKKILFFIPLLAFSIIACFEAAMIIYGINVQIIETYVIPLYTIITAWVLINLHNRKQYTSKKDINSGTFLRKTIASIVIIALLVTVAFMTARIYELSITREETGGELVIYDWGGYFPENSIEEFGKEFNVSITKYSFEDEYDMYEDLKNNPEKYDFIFSSDALISTLIEEDLIQTININNIPNLKNIENEFINLDYNSEGIYAVPYTWGTTGLIYNNKYVEEVNSWEILWDPKYKGRIATIDSPDEIIGFISKYSGGKLVPDTSAEVFTVKKFFEALKPNLRVFNDYDIEEVIGNEEIWIGVVYNGAAGLIIENNSNYTYVLPEEGFSGWIDNMAIPKGAKNKKNAELFINYMLRPEVSAQITNELWYLTCNFKAEEFIEEEILSDDSIFISKEEFRKLEFFSDKEENKNVARLKNEVIDWIEVTREHLEVKE